MSKSEKVFNWLLIGIFAILFVCIKQVAADPANGYGSAEFYNPIHIPRDNIKGRWLLDTGVEGNSATNGDFENWSGAEGGCTDCPIDWTCNCVAGDILTQTTEIYKSNTSLSLVAAGAYTPSVIFPQDFIANEIYQITFCYFGVTGTEDFIFGLANAALTETYNPATDTWTAPVTGIIVNNAPASWTCDVMYVKVGAVSKLAASGYAYGFLPTANDGSAVYFDNLEFRKLKTAGVVGERGNILSVPVTADPQFGDSPLLQHKPGAGQVTERGMKLDGVDDYVSRADDDTFDPVTWNTGGSFTVGCRVMTNTIAATSRRIINKYVPALSWWLYCFTNLMYFGVSNDNANVTELGIAGVITNTLQSTITRYVYDGVNLSADVWLYLNEETVATSNVFRGPPFNAASPLVVGASGTPANFWDGQIGECTIWEGDIGEVAANKYRNPYFPGSNHGDGFYVDTCSQAASHATCTLDSCRDGTPAACQAEGTGVMAVFGQREELCADNSGETLTGDDSDPDFTHWVETEVAGDGSANITAYRADVHHGQVSFRLTTTGTTSQADIASTCIPVSPATEYYIYAKTKKLSGTARFWPILIEYSDGACANSILSNTLYDGDIAEGGWGNALDTSVTTNGSTNSVLLDLLSYQSASDFLVDEISVKAASYHTPWVHNVGAGSITYNARDYRLHNPLSDRSDVLREDMYESGFCISTWVYNDWEAEDGIDHDIFNIPGTAGNNNHIKVEKTAGNGIIIYLYDGAAASRYVALAVTDTNWTAGNWKYLEVCSNNTDNVVAGHFYNVSNSTWYTLGGLAGAGTGIQDGQSTEIQLGHRGGVESFDGYYPFFHVGPYNAIFPLEGFNNGVAPINGRPY